MNRESKDELSFVRLFITVVLDWRLVMAVVVLTLVLLLK
jgi:hypothetical protein